MQSELLTKFYQSYYEWIKNGSPRGEPFNRHWGLCSNIGIFTIENYETILEEMIDQFINEKFDPYLPFQNVNSGQQYRIETSSESCHLNKARIKWVVDHLSTKDIL